MTWTTKPLRGSGLLEGRSGTVSGYEIHMGRTQATETVGRPLGEGSAARGRVLGTYLHGLFANEPVREAFLDAVFEYAGVSRPEQENTEQSHSPYDQAVTLLCEHLDVSHITGL